MITNLKLKLTLLESLSDNPITKETRAYTINLLHVFSEFQATEYIDLARVKSAVSELCHDAMMQPLVKGDDDYARLQRGGACNFEEIGTELFKFKLTDYGREYTESFAVMNVGG